MIKQIKEFIERRIFTPILLILLAIYTIFVPGEVATILKNHRKFVQQERKEKFDQLKK